MAYHYGKKNSEQKHEKEWILAAAVVQSVVSLSLYWFEPLACVSLFMRNKSDWAMEKRGTERERNVCSSGKRDRSRATRTYVSFDDRSKAIIFINCSINSIIDFRTNRIYVVNGNLPLMVMLTLCFHAHTKSEYFLHILFRVPHSLSHSHVSFFFCHKHKYKCECVLSH